MTAATTLLRDQRGSSSVQLLVLTVALALAGIASVKVLSSGLAGRSECLGVEIQTMAPVRCAGDGQGLPASLPQPPAPPPSQPGAGDDDARDDDDDEPEEPDPGEELLEILGDLIGINDAIKCVTEGDILACAFTVLNFTPGKVFALGFKLISKANKIRKAVERFLAARKAKKAEEEARLAKEQAEKEAKEKAEKEAREKAEKEAKERAEQVKKCEAIHASYKSLGCRGCRSSTTRAEVNANITCLAAEVAGRGQYLSEKCDNFLAGSIARGSATAEAGHKVQLTDKTNALNKCNQKLNTLPP